MKDAQYQIFSGSVAGMANQTICHPFDTIRTRLQMKPELKGPIDCFTKIAKFEGILGFYKGFTAPFIAQAFYKSVLFSVNAFARELCEENQIDASVTTTFACGAVSGTVNSFIVTPVELVRNQLMMQINNSNKPYNGPRHFVTLLYKNSDSTFEFIRRLYRGLPATIIRDTGGVGFWFLGFGLGINKAMSLSGSETEFDIPMYLLMLSGSIGGLAFWCFALPFDCIKSRMQCVNMLQRPQPKLLQVVRSMKLRDFRRGWQVALGRGIPGAATTLTVHHLVYEHCHMSSKK